MKKKLSYILLIAILFIAICSLVVTITIKIMNNNEINYIIHYHSENFVYDIETKQDYIYIKKSEVVQCIQAPCNPIEIDNFKIKYKGEYQALIENLFKDKETKEITIKKDDLSEENTKIISDIVKEDSEYDNNISYNILESYQYDNGYKERGYYVKQLEDGKVRVTIAMGEQYTGGYSISILKVNIIDEKVQIYVEETYPTKDSIVTQALTYPIAQIEFNKMPKYIIVQNLDTSLEFEKIN